MISRRRWLAGWGLLSVTYLVLAGVRGLGTGDAHGALVSVSAAVVTFAFAAAVLPIMVPRRKGGGPRGDGGPKPEEPPPPPWWPEFERDFRRHAKESRAPERRPSARV